MPYPNQAALGEYHSVSVQTGVTAADAHGLILLLYDGAMEALSRGKRHMERGEIQAKCDALAKATNIIAEGLKASLDVKTGGQIAQNLSDLYDYMTDRLLLANQTNRPELVVEVMELLRQLSDAWRQIGKSQTQAPAAAAARAAKRSTTGPVPASAPAPSAESRSAQGAQNSAQVPPPSAVNIAKTDERQSKASRIAQYYGVSR